MTGKHIFMMMGACAMGACALLLSGCEGNAAEQADGGQTAMEFHAAIPSLTAESGIRAAFPNNRSIAVVAANATAGTVDWNSLYLDHLAATAVGNDSPYSVTFNPKQYWPFNPDKYLGFVAYSPAIQAGAVISATGTTLTVDIKGKNAPFPDLLYTTPVGPFNKEHKKDAASVKGSADLGEFKHAMARVAVKVIVVNRDGVELTTGEYNLSQVKALQITSLTLSTKVTGALFNLLTGGWTLSAPGEAQPLLRFVNANTGVPYNSDAASAACYLLPSAGSTDMVAQSELSFKVRDTAPGGVEVGGIYPLADFRQDDNTPVTLVAGKTTLLTIKVQLTPIPPVDPPNIWLEGQLTEWDYKGESKVEIQ